MELPDATIDQYQSGHFLLLANYTFVATCDHLAHRGEIVYTFYRSNNELAVVGFLHLSVFPHDHRRDRLRALNMRDVKAFDAPGEIG